MTARKVNPPPQLKIPPAFLKDRETREFVKQQNTILFQLWHRTGGNEDFVDELITGNDISRALATKPAQLFNLKSQIEEASDRIEANEIDLSTRPRMSDLFKINQRVDELIDELIEQLENLNIGSEAQKSSVELQVEMLKQTKLLNVRFEEMAETHITDEDIEV